MIHMYKHTYICANGGQTYIHIYIYIYKYKYIYIYLFTYILITIMSNTQIHLKKQKQKLLERFAHLHIVLPGFSDVLSVRLPQGILS